MPFTMEHAVPTTPNTNMQPDSRNSAAVFGPHPRDDANSYDSSWPGIVADTSRPAASYPYADLKTRPPCETLSRTIRPATDLDTSSVTDADAGNDHVCDPIVPCLSSHATPSDEPPRYNT